MKNAYYLDFGTFQASSGINEIPDIGFDLPGGQMRYNYTVAQGITGNLATSMLIIATEISDADLDGIDFESVLMNELGQFQGDFFNN